MNKVQTANKVSQQELTGASGQSITALRYTGDISSASKEPVVGAYQALDKATHRFLLLDFKGVEYLNSSGIALVIQVLMEANKARAEDCHLQPDATLHEGSSPWLALLPSMQRSTPMRRSRWHSLRSKRGESASRRVKGLRSKGSPEM